MTDMVSYYSLFRVDFEARFVTVCGLLQDPLYDLFESVITRLRVTCLDVNMCVLIY